MQTQQATNGTSHGHGGATAATTAKPYAVVMTVGPEQAAVWLEKAHGQRPLRERNVSIYANAMRDGIWRLDSNAIAFDSAGHLINGQHRLTAVTESGVACEFIVVFNMDPDSFGVLDQALTRTPSDFVHQIAGERVSEANKVAAIARYMLQGARASLSFDSVTKSEVAQFAVENMDCIQPFLPLCGRFRAGAAAAFANAIMTKDDPRFGGYDRTLVVAASKRLLTMSWTHDSDPMKTLYRRLDGMSGRHSRVDGILLYRVAARAVQSVVDGQPLKVIRDGLLRDYRDGEVG